MNVPIESTEIMSLIPHRFPFLLVDRVEDYKANDFLRAVKNVTINESFFSGHFPEEPIMPGVLMIEALAQASGLLHSLSEQPKEGYKHIYYFAGVANVKFKRKVIPGDVLQLDVEVSVQKKRFWQTKGVATVNGEVACMATMLSASKEVKRD